MNKLSSIVCFLRSSKLLANNKRPFAITLKENYSKLTFVNKLRPNNTRIGKTLSVGFLLTFGYCVTNYFSKRKFLEFSSPLKALSLAGDQSGNGSKSNNFIADVVEKVASAVVYIEISGRHPFTNQKVTLSNGSGFIVESDGLILTNAHVVGNERTVVCKLYDGSVFKAVVENRDLQKDLATLRIPAKDLPTIKLGDSSKLRPGEFVVAVGSPLSLSNTITAGVISSVHRASKELGLNNSEMDYIQTDASITFGNSGGPLVNMDGEAIGINTMKVTAGISFAIPASYAKEFLLDSKTKKEKGWFSHSVETPRKRYLGITMLTLTPNIIAELQQRRPNFPTVDHGVLIWKIVLDSPAHQGGLQPGDIITHINRKNIVSSQDVYKAISSNGKPLKVTIRRDHSVLELTVSPEEIA